ncbi:MAG: hypothetical protein QM726_19320 [Chitinophagaceae bacterium]
MDDELLVENVEQNVKRMFGLNYAPRYPYHNLQHTEMVKAHVTTLSAYYNLPPSQAATVTIAAWFHDVGQLFGPQDGHEERSILLMEAHLQQQDAASSFINGVSACIAATQHGKEPQDLLQQILCDADTWHFGTPYFRQTEFLVKQEMELRLQKAFAAWHTRSLQMLQQHQFYTGYCKMHLQKGKQENIEWLQSLQ